MLKKTPPHLPASAKVPVPEERVRALSDAELEKAINSALNRLEAHEDKVKRSKQWLVRFLHDFDADQLKIVLNQLLDERKRRKTERLSRVEAST